MLMTGSRTIKHSKTVFFGRWAASSVKSPLGRRGSSCAENNGVQLCRRVYSAGDFR